MIVKEREWPLPRARIRAEWDGGNLTTRVMRPVDELTILCRIPDDLRHDELPDPDTVTQLMWADPDGLWTRPVRLGHVTFALMTLVAEGPSTHQQRRRFYRASVGLDVTLVAGARQRRGRTHDLSEGGAYLHIDGSPPPPATEVTARMTVDGKEVTVPGRVVRSSDEGLHSEVGVAFGDMRTPVADLIRKEVFTAQVKARHKETPR